MWVFYIPIVLYCVPLFVRYRGLTFLSVNPGLPMSGLIGECKAHTLSQLVGTEELARFRLIDHQLPVQQRIAQAQQFMAELDLQWPVVLKPDFGQRGQDVAVIRTEEQLCDYLRAAAVSILIQEHIKGFEYGLFYTAYPTVGQGEIFSITQKTFPIVVGDGHSTLEQLMMANPRTHYMAEYLLTLHQPHLHEVLPTGQEFKVVEIGSHCRGSVFLDGNHLITDALNARLASVSSHIEGFYFGRYDVRAESAAALQAGEFKVLEVNGVTSESTNIYDPEYSVLKAWKILFRQWRHAFAIGAENIRLGAPRISLFQLLSHLRNTYFR